MSSFKKPKLNKFLNNTKRVVSVTNEDSEGLKRDDSLKRAFYSSANQFLLETSLHGLQHIAKRHYNDHDTKVTARLKTFIGNYSWIIATLSGALFSIYMMILVWNRFTNTPTVTTVETINNPISEVPFPAVTVCNINKVHYPNTKRIRDVLKAHDIDDENTMSYLGNLSRLVTMDNVHEHNVRVEYLLERLGYQPEALIREFTLGCSEMLSNCSWLGKSMPCNQLFRMIKSSQGFCCSFNYHGLRELYDINYDNYNMSLINASASEYVSGAGEYVGLIFKVDTKPKDYTSPTENYHGAEIIIHNSMDFPDLTTSSAVVQPGEDLRLAIQPEIIVSQPGIRSMDVEQRNCWYHDEHELVLAKQYTFESCMAECRAEHNIGMCHCMMFMFPLHKPASEDGYVRQCGMRDLFCLRDIRHILFSLVKPSVKEENVTGMDCNCLPSCSTTLYKLDPNIGEMVNDGREENAGESIVYVFFKDLTCLKYRRDPFMNWDSLFASFGGIFGLCLGGSIISLIEIIYFLTFKFYTNLLNFRHEFRLNYLRNLVARKTNNDYPVFHVIQENTNNERQEQTFLW